MTDADGWRGRPAPDVIIIGAGVVGLTTALMLADEGVAVTVLERQLTGREASWAGAGMLPPGNLAGAATPEARLRSYSHSLWPELAVRLSEQTGIDTGYRVCGAMHLGSESGEGPESAEVFAWRNEGVRCEPADRSEMERWIPGLHPEFQRSSVLPDYAQVRNPRWLSALAAACRTQGVEILEHVSGLQLIRQADRITEVRWSGGNRLSADRVCLAAGAWSAELLETVGRRIPLRPIRGQIVQLQTSPLPFHSVILLGDRYLVPRPDGLILAGSTEEDVGFDRRTTAAGVADLIQLAVRIVPELGRSQVVRTWAGLRPGTADGLPLLGQCPGITNLYLGAGHFRSGLQMSPGTGRVLADLLRDRRPAVSLEGLGCDRFPDVSW